MNGGSQAIRIPAIARFSGDEVLLTFDTETNMVTLEAVPEEPNLLKLLDEWARKPIADEVWSEFDAKIAELRRPLSSEQADGNIKQP